MASSIRNLNVGVSGPDREGAWPRYVNIAAGTWLFFSGLVFRMSQGERLDVMLVGFLIAAAGVWALWREEARFANSALAVWLLFSTLVFFELNRPAFWNNLALSLVVFGVSLVPSGERRPDRVWRFW